MSRPDIGGTEQGIMTVRPIAHIRTDFPEKFGIPRQSGRVPDLEARIVFEPPYRNPDALRGLEGFSHLLAVVAVFRGTARRRRVATHGTSAAPRREYPDGCVRHAFALPSQPDRSVLRAALPH